MSSNEINWLSHRRGGEVPRDHPADALPLHRPGRDRGVPVRAGHPAEAGRRRPVHRGPADPARHASSTSIPSPSGLARGLAGTQPQAPPRRVRHGHVGRRPVGAVEPERQPRRGRRRAARRRAASAPSPVPHRDQSTRGRSSASTASASARPTAGCTGTIAGRLGGPGLGPHRRDAPVGQRGPRRPSGVRTTTKSAADGGQVPRWRRPPAPVTSTGAPRSARSSSTPAKVRVLGGAAAEERLAGTGVGRLDGHGVAATRPARRESEPDRRGTARRRTGPGGPSTSRRYAGSPRWPAPKSIRRATPAGTPNRHRRARQPPDGGPARPARRAAAPRRGRVPRRRPCVVRGNEINVTGEPDDADGRRPHASRSWCGSSQRASRSTPAPPAAPSTWCRPTRTPRRSSPPRCFRAPGGRVVRPKSSGPEALRRRHPPERHHLRHRAGRHRQVVAGGGLRRAGAPGQAGRPHHPHPARRSRPASGSGFLPGDLMAKVDPYLRPLYDALHDMVGHGGRAEAAREGRGRGRPARVHARPHAQQQLHHLRRGPEHHARADEDVPHPHRLRLPGRRHRRRHPGRRAGRALRPPGPRGGAHRHRRAGVGAPHQPRRRAPPHRAGHRRRLRAGRPTSRRRRHRAAATDDVRPVDDRRRRRARRPAPRRRRSRSRAAAGGCPEEGDLEVFVGDEQDATPVDAARWQRLAEPVLRHEGIAGDAELSMLFVDEAAIADLNDRFMELGRPHRRARLPARGRPRRAGPVPRLGHHRARRPPRPHRRPGAAAAARRRGDLPVGGGPQRPRAPVRAPRRLRRRTSWRCWSSTASSTCSATTTPSPRRPRGCRPGSRSCSAATTAARRCVSDGDVGDHRVRRRPVPAVDPPRRGRDGAHPGVAAEGPGPGRDPGSHRDARCSGWSSTRSGSTRCCSSCSPASRSSRCCSARSPTGGVGLAPHRRCSTSPCSSCSPRSPRRPGPSSTPSGPRCSSARPVAALAAFPPLRWVSRGPHRPHQRDPPGQGPEGGPVRLRGRSCWPSPTWPSRPR